MAELNWYTIELMGELDGEVTEHITKVMAVSPADAVKYAIRTTWWATGGKVVSDGDV